MGMIQFFYPVEKEDIDKLAKLKYLDAKINYLEAIDDRIDIDKTWDLLLYLVTKTKGPSDHIFSNLFYSQKVTIELSPEEKRISEAEADYFFNHKKHDEILNKLDLSIAYLTPAEIKEIAEFMQTLSINQLVENCDFLALNAMEVYPENWTGSKENIDYVSANYQRLFDFLLLAARQDKYVLSLCEQIGVQYF